MGGGRVCARIRRRVSLELMDVRAWIEAYGRAWREGDEAAAASLFTENGVYRSHPLREPHVGREAIRAYWRGATFTQEQLDLRFGEPIVAGSRAAVEWWATMREDGEDVTLPGILVLRFAADGRCEELREAWHYEPGRRDPPGGWGR
jgi:ketosteroid isomerase-like protein